MPVPLKGVSMVQRYSTGAGEIERQAEAVIALDGFFESLRVPLLAGRPFTTEDQTRPVVIVDQRLAEEVWRGRSALGQRLVLISPLGRRPVEVIGVAGHVQTQGLRNAGPPQIWMTYASKSYTSLDLVVRGANPAGFIGPVKEAVQRLGAGRPVHDVRLLGGYAEAASADTRFALFVLGALAVLALTLTVIGVYAVVAYATAQRTREIAVRLALGADTNRIVSLVMRQGAWWVAIGLAAGLAGARLLTGYVSDLLFKVTPHDLMTFACVAAGLSAVALAATAVPALRAVRIDPMLSLKGE